MSDTYEALFEAIRAKCQREHWFCPDCSNPKEYEDIRASDPNFDRHTLETEAELSSFIRMTRHQISFTQINRMIPASIL